MSRPVAYFLGDCVISEIDPCSQTCSTWKFIGSTLTGLLSSGKMDLRNVTHFEVLKFFLIIRRKVV